MRRWLLVAALLCMLGGATAAGADTATDIGTGYTSSNPAGQITAGLLDLDDANLHTTPAANKLGVAENAVNLTPDPTCANAGTNGSITWLDANESSSANSWTECYELKTGRTIFTGSDGSVLAAVTYDSSGNAVGIDLWGQGSGVDQSSAATVGTIAWAEAAIVAGGTIYLHPGSYYIATADTLTFNQAGVTLAGSNRSGAILIAQGAGFTGAMLRIGFTGAQLDNVTIRDIEFNGNKGNVTGSIAIHARDAKFSVLNVNVHDWKTGGILADSTVSTIVKSRVLDSKFFNGQDATYGIKTSDDAGGCLTDVVINRNEMGAAPIVIDECINGIQIEQNHIYGYLTDQACVQAVVASARYDWRIANNTIEDCGREAITISGGGADRGTIQGNTFYGNGCTTDATYSAISLASVDVSLISDNIIRSAVGGACPGGMTLHGIAMSSANNNRVIGNLMIGTSASSYAVLISGGGTNTVALNQCSGTCAGNVSDSITSDNQFNPDATYAWLFKDGVGILPDASNGVSVNSSGVLAKVGTGSVQADDVVCTDCVALGTETTGNYAGSSSEGGAATTAMALAADPSGCAADTYATTIAASGNLTCAAVSSAGITDSVVAQVDVDDSATLAGNPAFGASSVWFATTGLIFEGATSNASEGLLIAADVSADRTWTLPDETGTVCTTGAVCSGYQAGPLSGDVVTSGAAATIQANSVALGTDTTGAYVADNAAGTGIAVSGGGSETATVTVSLGYTSTLSGNPALGAGECVFASGASERGVVCEGATADTVEMALSFPDPASSDKTVTLPNATDTLVGKATTDTLTNKTLDVEGTGNSVTTVEKIWLAAAGCNNTTAASFWDVPTSNGAAAACVTGTNTQKGVLDFDATTDESVQTTVALPDDWTGNIDVKYKWLAASTSGSVAWCTQLICVADAETDDPSFPAQASGNCVSDAAKGTTLQTNDATDTAITATGCAAGELMHVRVSRDPDETAAQTDTMTGDARLIGVELTLRRAQ